MDESHEGYKLLRGVRLDIKTLLTNFEKKGSIRFNDFCEEWKKMKFSLIFCERKNFAELLEFCEEVIHLAKGYLEPPWNFHIRVGALYTLYGLYFKQPVQKSAKIRFTKDEWVHLSQLIEQCKEAKHYDICFIHFKLYVHGGYVFTMVPRATGLERGYRKYELKCRLNQNSINERILKRTNLIEPELLDSLASVENLYSEKKSAVLGKKNLEFVENQFASSLKEKLEKFYSSIQEKYPVRNLEDIGEANEPVPGTSSSNNRDEGASTSNTGAEPESAKKVKTKRFETILEKELKMTRKGRVRSCPPKRKRLNASDSMEQESEQEFREDNPQSLDLPEI